MLVAGIIVLVAAFAPTSANAVIPNSSLAPVGPATYNQNCSGVDPTTQALLQGLFPPNGVLVLPSQISTNAINSPSDGEDFTLQVTYTTTLPAFLVSVAQSAGTTTLNQTNTTSSLSATSGATGTVTSTDPGPTQINLPGPSEQARDIQFTQGPFDVTFTRSGTGTPVELTPGTVTTTSDTGTIALQLSCTPSDVTPLTLNDQAGPPPPPTTVSVTTLPFTPPTTAPASAGGGGTSGSGTGSATVTRTTALARTGFHAELLYVGIALLGAGYALSLAGRRVARASARSG